MRCPPPSSPSAASSSACSRIEERIERLNTFLEPFGIVVSAEDVSDWLTTGGVALGAFFYKQSVSLATGLLQFVFGFIFWVLVLFYLLVDGENARAWFRDTVPIPPDEQQQLSERFMEMASSLLVGNGLAGIIQGVAGGVVFAMAGHPRACPLGRRHGDPRLHPGDRHLAGFHPCVSHPSHCGRDRESTGGLHPPGDHRPASSSTGSSRCSSAAEAQMHTLLVFLSLIGGLAAYGAMGILIGPLMMTAFLTLVSIYQEHYRPWLDVPCAEPEASPEPEAEDRGD
jgi:hypothetical protein